MSLGANFNEVLNNLGSPKGEKKEGKGSARDGGRGGCRVWESPSPFEADLARGRSQPNHVRWAAGKMAPLAGSMMLH